MAAQRGDVPQSVVTAYEQGRRVAVCNVWRSNLARPVLGRRVGQVHGTPCAVSLAASLSASVSVCRC